MFNIDYEIRYSEQDTFGRLKPQVLLDFLSDIATKNADALHCGYKDITPKNMGWFLLKYAIEFDKYPQNLTKINIGTNPRGSNKMFSLRDFEIKTQDGSILGKATSTWGLIDLSSKKIISALDVFSDTLGHFEKKDDDIKYDKIPTIQNVSNEKIHEVGYYDIDINHHVNNTNFILWALDVIPIEFIKKKQIKRIDIAFKKELIYGSYALSQVEIFDKTTIHTIKNNESKEDLCLLKIEWI